jgi:hypothetical protein
MTDPIVDEVRKARDAYAAQFNYDLDAMVRDLQEQQRRSGRPMVPAPAKQSETANTATTLVPAPIDNAASPVNS